MKKFRLPKFATAPFCPSEIQGNVAIPPGASLWKKIFLFVGPGLLVSVGYMDPGNWATDIEAGSRFGYTLLFVVLASSLTAILLQCMSLKVGLATEKDLAQLSQQNFSRPINISLWLLAEIAIIACDVAEVLGSALAFKLLFGCSLQVGIGITILDTLIILGLQGKGFRKIEAIILGLILTIGICFILELFMVGPHWPSVGQGFLPDLKAYSNVEVWYLAIGIFGATVMPHNLYLHSALVQTRSFGTLQKDKQSAIRYSTFDTIISLSLAFFVNAAILILASAAFHKTGHSDVTSIDDAYRLLDPILGSSVASLLFAIALLAAGQSSTFTGTIAGQVIMEGFMNWRIPSWQRRLLTRSLALIPAYIGVSILGDHSTGQLLVLTQVILSLQLPFAIYPMIRFASNPELMKTFTLRPLMKYSAWIIFLVIVCANLGLLYKLFF